MKYSLTLWVVSVMLGMALATWAETNVSAVDTSSAAPSMETTMVIIKTSMGDIKVEVYNSKAPQTVANFLKYVDEGFYNGTIFHRVIGNFMIQGGGYTAAFRDKPTKAPIVNEAANGLKNMRGTLAMARTSVINSATCQFFINVVDNGFLDHRDKSEQGFGYCVFGKVIEGMDVVDRIKAVKTGAKGPFPQDVPLETVEIRQIIRVPVAP